MVVLSQIQAGYALADLLLEYREHRPLVIALSPGAVPIAWGIANRLRAPIDVLFPRVVKTPDDRQIQVGAVAGGRFYPDRTSMWVRHVAPEYAESLGQREAEIAFAQEQEYRGGAAPLALAARLAIAVDDGSRCSLAAYATIETLHELGVRDVVYASPVCTPGVSDRIGHDATVMTLCPPAEFRSMTIGGENPPETPAEEASRIILQSRRFSPAAPSFATTLVSEPGRRGLVGV